MPGELALQQKEVKAGRIAEIEELDLDPKGAQEGTGEPKECNDSTDKCEKKSSPESESTQHW